MTFAEIQHNQLNDMMNKILANIIVSKYYLKVYGKNVIN